MEGRHVLALGIVAAALAAPAATAAGSPAADSAAGVDARTVSGFGMIPLPPAFSPLESARSPAGIERRLAEARRAVKRAERAIVRAERRAENLDAEIFAAELRAGDPSLSDAEFRRAEADAAALAREDEHAAAGIGARYDALERARKRVRALRRLAAEHAAVAEAEATVVTFTRGTAGSQAAGAAAFLAADVPADPFAATLVEIDARLSPALQLAREMGLPLVSDHRPGALVAGSGSPSDHSYFPSKAIDIGGAPAGMHAYALAVAGLPGVDTVIYSPVGLWKAGTGWTSIRSAVTRRDHFDHVHVDTF